MSKVSPCLWFDGQAEEATRFYVSLLPDSRIDNVMRSTVDTPGGKKDEVLTVDFTLAGASYMALNGGPFFQFTPAISLFVGCEDQAEVDRLWEALLDGGSPRQCGWVDDRYGLSWQIIPKALPRLLKSEDRAAAARVMAAMMEMVKIDVAALEAAARG